MKKKDKIVMDQYAIGEIKAVEPSENNLDGFLKDRPNIKKVKFHFDDDKLFVGYHDGTTWNGWKNICVTEDVHKQVTKHFKDDVDCDLDTIEPDKYGMFSYAYGYCTSIYEEPTMVKSNQIDILTEQQKVCKKINKQIDKLIEDNKNKCITLLVHWNDYEIIEFHTIDTLMDKYSDITPSMDISHVAYSLLKDKPYNTYGELFSNIGVNEVVVIHNMTIVRIS